MWTHCKININFFRDWNFNYHQFVPLSDFNFHNVFCIQCHWIQEEELPQVAIYYGLIFRIIWQFDCNFPYISYCFLQLHSCICYYFTILSIQAISLFHSISGWKTCHVILWLLSNDLYNLDSYWFCLHLFWLQQQK